MCRTVSTVSDGVRPYLTVLRAPSAVRLIGEAETLLVHATGAHGGDGVMRITNAPRGAEWHLRFEVRALATGLEEAQETLGSVASRFAVALGLAANAAIAMLDLTACYCVDQGGGPRPFARDVTYSPRPGSVSPRDLDGDLGATVAAGLWDVGERVERSAWHFVRALDVWDPRLLSPSAGHLWIAAETLGPVVEELCIREAGVADWRALASAWELKADHDAQLHGRTTNEAILRHVFGGERELFNDLREFANGWEHGYRSFGTLREQATALVDAAARAVRDGLLDLIVAPGAERAALAEPRFHVPTALWSLGMRMGGTVDGPPDVFAPLTQPIEPAGSIVITAEPAPPPAWRTLEIQLCLDASEGHPPGARIILDSNTLVAPSGRAPDAHTFEEPTITLNGEVVDADARIVDDRASAKRGYPLHGPSSAVADGSVCRLWRCAEKPMSVQP